MSEEKSEAKPELLIDINYEKSLSLDELIDCLEVVLNKGHFLESFTSEIKKIFVS